MSLSSGLSTASEIDIGFPVASITLSNEEAAGDGDSTHASAHQESEWVAIGIVLDAHRPKLESGIDLVRSISATTMRYALILQ